MKRFILLISLMIFSLILSGCKKEDPNPELMDPIYSDLQKRAGDAQKSLEDELKKVEELKLAVEKAEPNSVDLQKSRKDLIKSQHLVVEFDQRSHYYRIRAQRRLLVDRISYKEAFAKDQKWPDPREYSDYQVNIRLEEAPRNWSARVPKQQDRVVSAQSKGEKATSKSEE